ncbi:MAG: ribonuclease P protein component [Vicinamibacterales bacterium]
MTGSFRPAEHIRKRADFERIYEIGSKCAGRLMTIFASRTEAVVARLGIAATRKIGSAVERNRAKRLVREIFRRHKPPAGTDVVVVPRRVILNAPYETIEAEFIGLLGRCDRRQRPIGLDGH